MNRRSFIKALGFGAVAATVAPHVFLDAPSAQIPLGTTTITSGSSAVFCVGDVFTISGKYMLNPITFQATSHLQTFVVTAIDGDDDGTTVTVSISPHRETSRAFVLKDSVTPLEVHQRKTGIVSRAARMVA